MLKALANEQPSSAVPTQGASPWTAIILTGQDDEPLPAFMQPQAEPEALLVSERVRIRWERCLTDGGTVQEAWEAAFHQLELQLDRGTFESWLRDAVLVDFEPETATFVVAVRTARACDMLQGRLYRTVHRILSDVYGQPVEVQYRPREAWVASEISRDRIA